MKKRIKTPIVYKDVFLINSSFRNSFIMYLILAVILIGCKKEVNTESGAEASSSLGLKSPTSTIIGVNEFYVGVCNNTSQQIEIYDPNDAVWNTSTIKFAWKPTTALNFTSTEVSAWGNPTDFKQRRIVTWDGQSTYYAVAGGRVAAIFNRADSKKVWARAFSAGVYPRAVELLPNGNIAVASMGDNWVRVYASSQGSSAATYDQVTLDHAKGLLYDPINDILWAVGTNALKAYQVGGLSTPTITEITSKSKTLPSGSTGLDVNCYYGDMNKLCVSTTTGAFIYNKTTGTFTATAGASNRADLTGFSNQPDGSMVQTLTGSATNVDFYTPNGTFDFSRTVSSGVFPRARTVSEYYQTRSEYAIATYNIRGQKTTVVPASLTGHGWDEREVPIARDIIKRYNFDIVAFQEPFKWQVEDMVEDLGGYSRFGYSDDGGNLGAGDTENHHHDIFYRTNLFEVVNSGKFWLALGAPTSPPAGLNDGWTTDGKAKVCVWLKLRDKVTLNSFYVFNAHFYFASGTTRQKSAQLIVSQIPSILSSYGQAPVIFMGDLNTSVGDAAWNTIQNSTLFQESYDWASTISPSTYRATHVAEGYDGNGVEIWHTSPQALSTARQNHQIDNIFLTSDWQSKVISRTVIWDNYVDNSTIKMPSDHLPVMVILNKP